MLCMHSNLTITVPKRHIIALVALHFYVSAVGCGGSIQTRPFAVNCAAQRDHVGVWYILGTQPKVLMHLHWTSKHILYGYLDPLGGVGIYGLVFLDL